MQWEITEDVVSDSKASEGIKSEWQSSLIEILFNHTVTKFL